MGLIPNKDSTDQVHPSQGGRSWSAQRLHIQSMTTPHLKNQPESLINEPISLKSMDVSSKSQITSIYTSKVMDIGRESRQLSLHAWQKSLNGICILSACLPIKQWPVSMAIVIEMMLRPSPFNWLVRLLSIEGQVSLAVEQDSSLIYDRLTRWSVWTR